MPGEKYLELLQFDKIKDLVSVQCHSPEAKQLCASIHPKYCLEEVFPALSQTNELKQIFSANGYFPSVEHENVRNELNLLGLDGAMLHEAQLLKLLKTTETCNTLVRFVRSKKTGMPFLYEEVADLEPLPIVPDTIQKIIDPEAQVRSNATPELQKIRQEISEKRRESDKRFYNYVNQLRRDGFLRENEEGFFNGRRTLAVMAEHKSEVNGFVHGKSESGKTIFIEPAATININNDIAELEIDERREVNRILRALCAELKPYGPGLRLNLDFLVYCDFLRAKALFAIVTESNLPELTSGYNLSIVKAYHPLLYLQNKRAGKKTIPLSIRLDDHNRVLVISGPNAGGKTIALKTVGLLQLMLQSGLLIPVDASSNYCFFDKILVDIGDTQSIENELSTYSAKLRSMTAILENVNESTLVLMDEFGSGTDPELGSAIAEAVLESVVSSKTRGIITSHFGNVKLLAEKLEGAQNASMLFDLDKLEPKYILSSGEPGSSYTFEVAEKVGFPKRLIERAKLKVNKDNLRLDRLLNEVQSQKTRLEEQMQKAEHEEFLKKIAKEKYHALFDTWQKKMNRERDRKIELARLADYGQKYLRLMEDWQNKKDRKEVIKRFIDGITAETKKQEQLQKQKKLDSYAEKKIARLKPKLKVGSKVKVLNGREIGTVVEIKDEKVFVSFGLMKMTVGMENLVLAEE